MGPRIWRLGAGGDDAAWLKEAAQVLTAGELVAFPTETVYGLGADATNPQAIARLNQVKGRPPEKPYSLHLSSVEQMCAFVTAIPPLAERLMQRFWPGPLTIVLPGKDGKTVGFRLPSHPVTQAFLKACARPVAAPSANRSGARPPTDAREVLEALNGDLAGIVDAGPTPLGRESTVVEVLGDRVLVHREGAIPSDAIEISLREISE